MLIFNFNLVRHELVGRMRMKIIGWSAKVEDRQEWNRIVEQTKTHPGL